MLSFCTAISTTWSYIQVYRQSAQSRRYQAAEYVLDRRQDAVYWMTQCLSFVATAFSPMI